MGKLYPSIDTAIKAVLKDLEGETITVINIGWMHGTKTIKPASVGGFHIEEEE